MPEIGTINIYFAIDLFELEAKPVWIVKPDIGGEGGLIQPERAQLNILHVLEYGFLHVATGGHYNRKDEAQEEAVRDRLHTPAK